MDHKDARTFVSDFLVLGSEALLAGLGALTVIGLLLAIA